jgi:hypothetical protein
MFTYINHIDLTLNGTYYQFIIRHFLVTLILSVTSDSQMILTKKMY